MNYKVGVIKRVAFLLMTMALAVAMVACEGAVGKPGLPGEPGQPGKPGLPGKPADPVLQPPYVVLELLDLPGLVQGMSDTVDLSEAFGDPDGTAAALRLSATSTDPAIATASVSGTTLTVTGVKAGKTAVRVTATDADNLSVAQSVQVTVVAAPPEPDPPVTIDDVKAKYPSLVITPTTAADASKEIELPADYTLISEDSTVVTVVKKAAAAPPASSIRWASATADTTAKNVWVITAVSEGITDVDVLDKSGASVHTIRVRVAADPPPPPVPTVAPTLTAEIDDMMLYLDDGAADPIDLSEHFAHADEITYMAAVRGSAVDAEVSGSTLTVTPVLTGDSVVTVTATVGDKSIADSFRVNVMAGSTPPPPPPVPTVAPTLTAEIDDMMLYLDDGAADPIDLSEHFAHADEITYMAAVRGSAVDAEVSGSTLTVTPVLTGDSVVTVTATVGDKSIADSFRVNVMAGSTLPPPPPVPTVAPTLTAEIDDMMLYLDDGAADPIDLSEHFAHADEITYMAAVRGSAVDAEVSGSTLTVTPVLTGDSVVTVTATVGDKSIADSFRVNVMAGSTPPPPPPVPTVAPTLTAEIDDMMLYLDDGAADPIDLSEHFAHADEITYMAAVRGSAVDAEVSGSTLTVTPVLTGDSVVTVTATVGDKSIADSFRVNVMAGSTPPPPPPVPTVAPTLTAEIDDMMLYLDDGAADPIDLSEHFAHADEITYMAAVRGSAVDAEVSGSTLTVTPVLTGDSVVTVTATVGDKSIADSFRVNVMAGSTPPPPPPVPTVAPTLTAEIDDMMLYLDDGAADPIDLSEHFAHADEITYMAAVRGSAVDAEVSGSTLTVTPVLTGDSVVTVTATVGDKSIADSFRVNVMAGSTPPPPPPVPTVAPTLTAEIDDMMLYLDDGAADPIDLSEHFAHADEITYMAAVRGSAVDAEVSGSTLTVTPVLTGDSAVTVTATVGDKSIADSFRVNVMAGSKQPEPMPDPTPDSSPAELTFDDTETQTVDITGYIPDDADPADYYLDSDDNKVVTANEKDGSDSIWEIDPVAFGTTTIYVIETANGDEVDKITVEVKNRSPYLEDDQDDPTIGDIPVHASGDMEGEYILVPTKSMTLNRDGTMLVLYSVTLTDLHEYFGDPDEAGDDEEITFTIRSSHRDVLVHRQKDDCVRESLGGCDIFLDFRMIPQRIDEFRLSVKAQDKAGEMSSEVVFPFWFPATPPMQTYIAHQSPANHNLRDITVGDRRGVAHKLKFKDDLLGFIGENDDAYSGTNTLAPAASPWEVPLFGDDPDDEPSTNDGSVRKIGFQFDGGIRVEVGTNPSNNDFSMGNVGSYVGLRVVSTRPGTVVIREWAYWDRDGIATGATDNATEPMWHIVDERTLDVNVRSVR